MNPTDGVYNDGSVAEEPKAQGFEEWKISKAAANTPFDFLRAKKEGMKIFGDTYVAEAFALGARWMHRQGCESVIERAENGRFKAGLETP